jgi:hypothetical protein
LISDIEGRTQAERVFENRVLRNISGPKRGGWGKLYNEELRNI